MQLLFASCASEEKNTNNEPCSAPTKRNWYSILIEQLVNASIVAGVAACSISFDSWEVPMKAFGITFFIELRKYRKL